MKPDPIYYDTDADWRLIPEHMREGLARYVMEGILPGDFLQAVLRNDLIEAALRADGSNLAAIHGWAIFLINYTPTTCRGSPAAVEAWVGHRGLASKP